MWNFSKQKGKLSKEKTFSKLVPEGHGSEKSSNPREDSYPPEADGGSSPPHATVKLPRLGSFYCFMENSWSIFFFPGNTINFIKDILSTLSEGSKSITNLPPMATPSNFALGKLFTLNFSREKGRNYHFSLGR